MKQIKDCLKKFGIDSPKITCSVRKGALSSHGYKYNRDYWVLVISKKSELKKLLAMVGPYIRHESRAKNLGRVRQNIKMRGTL